MDAEIWEKNLKTELEDLVVNGYISNWAKVEGLLVQFALGGS